MKNELKILINVFINTSEFSWNDLKTLENRKTIVKRLPSTTLPDNARIIDGNFNIVIPGTIDPHVHFDTPGFEFRDTFEEASTAAAYGGVTTIIDMPCTSLPPVTSKENFTRENAFENKFAHDAEMQFKAEV